MSLIGNCSSEGFRLSGNRPCCGEVSGRSTYWRFRENLETVRTLWEKARNGESNHQYVSVAGRALAQSVITHNYLPPKLWLLWDYTAVENRKNFKPGDELGHSYAWTCSLKKIISVSLLLLVKRGESFVFISSETKFAPITSLPREAT